MSADIPTTPVDAQVVDPVIAELASGPDDSVREAIGKTVISGLVEDKDKAFEMATAELPLREIAKQKSGEFADDFNRTWALSPEDDIRQEAKRLDAVAAKEAAIKAGEDAGELYDKRSTLASEAEGTPEEKNESLNPRVESLAVPLARDYAEKNYPKRADGTFEPAWRGANGEKPLRGKTPEDLIAEGMSPEEASRAVIDIANTPYDQFSEHWKSQNRGGAEYLIALLDERGAEEFINLDLSDPAVRSELGNLIHENWISRNEWVKDPEYGNPDLAKPFDDLSPEEQQKDIDQVGVLKTWIAQQSQK